MNPIEECYFCGYATRGWQNKVVLRRDLNGRHPKDVTVRVCDVCAPSFPKDYMKDLTQSEQCMMAHMSRCTHRIEDGMIYL